MKSEKGITMLAVTIYVLVLTIVIGIIANISNFFYKNVSNVKEEGRATAVFNTFDMYFKREFERKGNEIEKIDESSFKSYIVFQVETNFLIKIMEFT